MRWNHSRSDLFQKMTGVRPDGEFFLKNWGSARHSNKNSGRRPPLIGNGLRHCVINSGKGLVLKDQNRALTDEPAKGTWGTQHVVVHRTMETARRGFKSHRGDVCNCCFFCTFCWMMLFDTRTHSLGSLQVSLNSPNIWHHDYFGNQTSSNSKNV